MRRCSASRYANVFEGPEEWKKVKLLAGVTFSWDMGSTYLANPPYFDKMPKEPGPLSDVLMARELAILGDSITTDHISPAGSIKKDSPAGEYLLEHQVRPAEFNSYGARRGNHEVMMRGTFANIRIKNEMVPGVEGGMTKHMPDGEVMPIYDAAMQYQKEGVPLVIIAGKEYGTGSSRDWAAKGTKLLGVKAVIVESFERIHRSNLVGMGVMPLQFKDGMNRQSLKLDGSERFDVLGIAAGTQAAHRARLPHPSRGRQDRDDPAAVPHRHARRARIFPPRRHPALRPPQHDEGGVSPEACHCERSEAISRQLAELPAGDCFVASLLAMTAQESLERREGGRVEDLGLLRQEKARRVVLEIGLPLRLFHQGTAALLAVGERFIGPEVDDLIERAELGGEESDEPAEHAFLHGQSVLLVIFEPVAGLAGMGGVGAHFDDHRSPLPSWLNDRSVAAAPARVKP